MFNVPKKIKKIKRRSWSHDVSGYELSDGDNVWFDVTLDGKTYRIDANHKNPKLYDNVPKEILELANKSNEFIDGRVISSIYVDPAPLYQEALEKVFDKVEFVSSDWKPGRIY